MLNRNKVLYSRKSIVWLFIVPSVTLYVICMIYPLFSGLFTSFTNQKLLEPTWEFVGFDNYVKLFNDRVFQNAFKFTLKYAVVYIVLTNVLALLISFLVDSVAYGKALYRSAFFVPNILGGITVALIWKFIFTGLYPQLMEMLGVTNTISWFGSKDIDVYKRQPTNRLSAPVTICRGASAPTSMLHTKSRSASGCLSSFVTTPVTTFCMEADRSTTSSTSKPLCTILAHSVSIGTSMSTYRFSQFSGVFTELPPSFPQIVPGTGRHFQTAAECP